MSYSTTFAGLRQERRDWTARHDTARHDTEHAGDVLTINDWHYAGRALPTGGRHD